MGKEKKMTVNQKKNKTTLKCEIKDKQLNCTSSPLLKTKPTKQTNPPEQQTNKPHPNKQKNNQTKQKGTRKAE